MCSQTLVAMHQSQLGDAAQEVQEEYVEPQVAAQLAAPALDVCPLGHVIQNVPPLLG